MILEQGTENLAAHLCHIFRICLTRGYVPRAWRQINVMLSPDPGSLTIPRLWNIVLLLFLQVEFIRETARKTYQGRDPEVLSFKMNPVCLPTR